MTRHTVTRFRREHLASAAELEAMCFSSPWSARALELLLGEDAYGVVCLQNGAVAAYGGMTFAPFEASVTNIAVHPDARRQGLGEAVLHGLLQAATAQGAQEIFLEVRVSNGAAIALYEKAGFETVGKRRNFYRAPTEDALIMKKTLSADAEGAERI